MRSCIYCGRDLEKDEKCQCSGAQAARKAKESATNTAENSDSSGWQQTTYTTGYTKKKKKFQFKKPHFKKPDFKGKGFKDAANAVSGFTRRFIKDPVNTIANPGHLNGVQMALIILLTGLAISVCGYFVYARILSPFLAASPYMAVYKSGYGIGELLRFSLQGMLSISVMEIIFIGVLFLINKFILRQNTSFLSFAVRPVAAFIPLMVFAILGAVISIFSVYATVMLVAAGNIMTIILVYEALGSEWSFVPSSRVLYLTAVSYFVFFVVIFNFIRIL